MTPGLRKFTLTAHLTLSVGWIGAAVAYLALSVSAVTSQDPQTIRAAWIAKEFIGWFVVVPSSLAALLTGILMSVGTPWGLFRHYWVLFTLVLTIFAIVVLLLRMPSVSALAGIAREADAAGLDRLESDLLHPGVGLLVLIVITALNVYKPRGLTAYGWRREQEEQRRRRDPVAVRSSNAGAPRPGG
jgi:hypothetical protein